jgi:hypothetical protein
MRSRQTTERHVRTTTSNDGRFTEQNHPRFYNRMFFAAAGSPRRLRHHGQTSPRRWFSALCHQTYRPDADLQVSRFMRYWVIHAA